jgi:CHAD domain-containing protein
MKGIQDFLGDFQDLAVQQVHLSAMARQMAEDERASEETLAALAALVASLADYQHRSRHKFPRRFEVFSMGLGRRGFMRLYAPRK